MTRPHSRQINLRQVLDRLAANVEKSWYRSSWLNYLLLPLSGFYRLLICLRRGAYQCRLLSSQTLQVPVMVVGNITVGGTGKTPLVIWLAKQLRERGWQVGIITRGYKGGAVDWPQWVDEDSNAASVGDEALMLARCSGCPVVAGPKRIDSAQLLLSKTKCNIIISDDGLQHYALNRDIEIAVIDAQRVHGNGFVLPAGPLREPVSRLQQVDMQVVNGGTETKLPNVFSMRYRPHQFVHFQYPNQYVKLDHFNGKSAVAIAGVGHPERFFNTLTELGISIDAKPYPDHYAFQQKDFSDLDGRTLIMTHKDAVKCESLDLQDAWYLEIEVETDKQLLTSLLKKIKSLSLENKFHHVV